MVIPFTSAQQEGGPYGIVDDDEGQTYKWSWNSATKANVKAYFTLAENTGMITLKTSPCLESGLVAQPCLDFYADDTSDYYCYWPDRCIEDKDGDVRSDPKYNQKKYELIIDIEDDMTTPQKYTSTTTVKITITDVNESPRVVAIDGHQGHNHIVFVNEDGTGWSDGADAKLNLRQLHARDPEERATKDLTNGPGTWQLVSGQTFTDEKNNVVSQM